jgi:hypothetical protein
VARRIYFPSSGSPAVTPSTWNFANQINPVTLPASLTPTGTTMTSKAEGTGTTNPTARAMGRWIIGPLKAQTISGTVKGQIRGSESNAGGNASPALAIKIIQPGGADRAVLLAQTAADSATTGHEFVTSLTNTKFETAAESASLALSSQSATAGDYLVIEIGFRSATSVDRTITLRYGDADATDLPEDTTTTADNNPWVEFSATVLFSFAITADAGSYAVTGTNAALKFGRKVTADAGSSSVTGTPATLKVGRRVSAAAGSYAATGTDATLTYVSITTHPVGRLTQLSSSGTPVRRYLVFADRVDYSLAADAGSYAVTGTAAGLSVTGRLAADAGIFSLAGTAAALRKTSRLVAGSGAFTLTGTSATLVASRVLSAASGTYAITGTSANLVTVPSVYLVMGGTETEGWFGSEAKGGPDSVTDVTFPDAVPIGAAVVVVMSVYQYNPTLSEVSDDGGNTWVIDKQEAAIIGGGSVSASVTLFRSILASPCNVFTYDATALPAGDAGRYGQLGAYVFNRPDTVNGFFTATPASNTQTSTSSVAPGTVTPDTNKSFCVFAGNNRGHTENLKPYVKPSGYTDTDLIHSEIDADGAESAVHNSTTQSGWWFGKHITTYTAETPTFGFAATTSGALSVFAIYNVQGGLANAVLDAEAGSYSVSGTTASLEYGREVAAASGTYALTGAAASLERGYLVVAAGGSYALTGTAAALRHGYRVGSASGTYTLTGASATVLANRLLVALGGSYAITGTAAALQYSGSTYTLSADAGSFAATGTTATLRVTHILTTASGSLAVIGTNAALRVARLVSAQAGSFAVAGTAATLRSTRQLVTASGSFTSAGTVATLFAGRRVSAQSGTFTLTGTFASLDYSGEASTYTLTADAGSFAATGTNASFRVTHVLLPQTGTLAVTGTSATLRATRRIVAASGGYSGTGTGAGLLAGYELTAATGTFALSGTLATVRAARVLATGSGSFLLTGTDVVLRPSFASEFIPNTEVTGSYEGVLPMTGTYESTVQAIATLEI